MRVLVTGGAGFIGSHLVDRLLCDEQCTVTVLDNFSTGRRENLDSAKRTGRLKIAAGSVLDKTSVMACAGMNDCVYHLASPVGVDLVMRDPAAVVSEIACGMQIVAGICNELRLPLVYTSSSEVYGCRDYDVMVEGDGASIGESENPRNTYPAAKLFAEFQAMHLISKDVPVVVARVFNTSGSRQVGDYGMVIPTFMRQARAGEPITIFGDGEQIRSFAHVDDVTKMLVKLMALEARTVVNVGSDLIITMNHLAALIKTFCMSKSEVVYRMERFNDMRYRRPDLQWLESLIGTWRHKPLDAIFRDLARECSV